MKKKKRSGADHGQALEFLTSRQLKKRQHPDAVGEAILKSRDSTYRQELVAVHFERVPGLMKKLALCVQVFSRLKIGRVIQLSKEFYATDSMANMRSMAEILGGAAAEECNSRYGDLLVPEEYARAAKAAFDISVADVAKHNRLTRGMITE